MQKKILIVDDEMDVVTVLAKRLSSKGYATSFATNGEQALKLIKNERFDLFILDIMMPAMDGSELAQIIKDDPTTKDIPIIFLTALGATETNVSPTNRFYVIFAKPYDFEKLSTTISQLLKK